MYLNGGNGIISKQSIDTMFYGDTVYVGSDIPFLYGYDWAIVKEPLSEPVLGHSGFVETGTSCIFILPEKDIAIASKPPIMGNTIAVVFVVCAFLDLSFPLGKTAASFFLKVSACLITCQTGSTFNPT